MNSHDQKLHGYRYNRETLYTCIVVIQHRVTDHGYNATQFLKYRNIDADKPAVFDRFKRFIRERWPEGKYLNLYGAMSGKYIRREYL